MMEFTISNPVVAGESAGERLRDPQRRRRRARTCDTTIELTRASGGEPFSERHRQYFHTDAAVRDALAAPASS